MNNLSDSESSNSGWRYKTESTRDREDFSIKRQEKKTIHYDNSNIKYKTRKDIYKDIESNKYEGVERGQSENQTKKNKSRISDDISFSKRYDEYRTSTFKKSSKSGLYDESDNKSNEKSNEKYKKNKKSKHKKDNEEQRRCSGKHNTMKSTSTKVIDKVENQELKLKIENLICGPSLPPHMLSRADDNSLTVRTYGPSLPSQNICITNNEEKTKIVDSENEDDSNVIGPILEKFSNKNEIYLELEKRALELKLSKLCEQGDKGDTTQQREEWMTELPNLPTVSGLGLISRQFKTKTHDEIKDRSLWTETPRDRENKPTSSHNNLTQIQHKIMEKVNRERKDAEQEVAVQKHKKRHKRNESLLEMHEKKIKKKNRKDDPMERRPFSRETDLKVNRFDEGQKKSILKKAQLLDTRFSSGQSKYL